MPVITYQITENDYATAQRLFAQCGSRAGHFVKFAIVGIGALLFGMGLYLKHWGLILGSFVYAAMPWWIGRLIGEPLARRQYRRYPAMHMPQTLSLLDDESGALLTSSLGESRVAWNLIIHWGENDSYLLLFLQPRMYFIVPKRADPEQLVIGRLRTLLRERVGEPRHTTDKQR
ncbi:YcxB family protein [Diaphorobacter caeni]|uniref:YcxB family protein n=1 Tax=Diaphorobacter caeni TaxID=2784387 RepID=UPI0018901FF1|nr:YcxB family protein [Diaphorobacter caeni]MBF5005483.1 YcxB family protein [Diaphorobacter caeni]